MLQYVTNLTDNPGSMEESDFQGMRKSGWTDRAILDVNLVASYFNFINRVDNGLGVEIEPWFES